MAMGSTSTVNITRKMMTDIKDAVAEYRDKAKVNSDKLDGEVNGLIPANYSGSAADAFVSFYNNTIVPATGSGVEDLLKALDEIAQGALDALPGDNGLDEQLADGNKQAQGGE